MNQNQRAYALNRVTTIASLQRTKLIEQHTVKAEKWTWKKCKAEHHVGLLLLNHKLIEKDHTSSLHPEEVFDLSGKVFPAYLSDEGVKAVAALEAASKRVQDEIMLGDSEEALKAIRNFEASLVAPE